MDESTAPVVGWWVTDPDGNVVQSGEVTLIEIDVLDELRRFVAEQVEQSTTPSTEEGA